ncbi:MAG: hypothetical protein GF353_03470 [Candidatus Lokiarchaeota archaeon]|nr:hypothetical protein [Candidatus Lokiarchaeota archaeon]
MKQIKTQLKNVVERYAYKNFHTAKAFQFLWFHSKFRRENNPILIYQMGKVGSSTLQNSLNAINLNRTIHHVHTLTKENLDNLDKVLKNSFHLTKSIPGHYVRGRCLLKQINADPGKKWTIITLVRDPIARNISSFFQDINHRFPEFNYPQKVKTLNQDELVSELIKLYLEKHDHEKPLWWFDKELKQTFGIDVYSTPFPKVKGYKIYGGQRAEVLLIRLENLSQCKNKAFKEFLNIDNFELINVNLAEQKDYSEIYDKFKSSICFPKSYIETFYNSKFVKHLYTQKEIRDFELKWKTENQVIANLNTANVN